MKASRLVSIGIPLKMDAPTNRPVAIRAVLRTADGRDVELKGERVLPVGGGVVLLQGNVGEGVRNVDTVRIMADGSDDIDDQGW